MTQLKKKILRLLDTSERCINTFMLGRHDDINVGRKGGSE